MTIIEDRSYRRPSLGSDHATNRPVPGRRSDMSPRSLRRRQLRRALATMLISSVGLAAVWGNRPPWLDWQSFAGSTTATWDIVGLVSSTLVVVALATLGYLTIVAGLNLLVGLVHGPMPGAGSHSGRVAVLARRATPRWLTAAAVSVAAASVSIPSVGAVENPTDPRTITLESLVDSPTSSTTTSARTMLPWAPAPNPSTPDLSSDPASTVPVPNDPAFNGPEFNDPASTDGVATYPSAAAPAVSLHSVEPGEHFWAIAERVVAERGHAEPVATYWARLVEENRDRLVDPGDPSLLHVGQTIVLP